MSLDTAVQNLVQRLEQVASRLEKVEKTLATTTSAAGAAPAAAAAAAPAAGGADASAHPSVVEFDDIVKEHIGKYVEQSNKIGGDVAKQARARQVPRRASPPARSRARHYRDRRRG